MTFVILSLAIARLTRLITTDSITEPIRRWVLYRWPTDETEFGDSEIDGDGSVRTLWTGVEVVKLTGHDGWLALYPKKWSEVFTCDWCAGFWVAIVVWVAYWFYPVTEVLLTPFALAYVAGFLNAHN